VLYAKYYFIPPFVSIKPFCGRRQKTQKTTIGVLVRLLIIEDNIDRIAQFTDWEPADMHFVFATSPGGAIGLINRDKGLVYCGICLDHDLQEQRVSESEGTFSGTQIATALAHHFFYEIPVLIHSMNETKASGMAQTLIKADFCVTRIPMTDLSQQKFSDWLAEVRENWSAIESLK